MGGAGGAVFIALFTLYERMALRNLVLWAESQDTFT